MRKGGWGGISPGLDSSERHPRSGWSSTSSRRPPLRTSLFPAATALLLCLVPGGPVAAQGSAKPAAPSRTPAKADSNTRHAVVIEGDDHMFMVAAPKGWVLDDTSGMGSRIRCVFYPKGQTWAQAPTVMYVNPMHGFGLKERTVSAMLAENEKQFHKRAPKGRVVDAGTLKTGAGKSAKVRHYSYDGGDATEAVAFVPENELIMLVVLSSRDAKGFQGGLAAFRELVGTYAWVGSNEEFGR